MNNEKRNQAMDLINWSGLARYLQVTRKNLYKKRIPKRLEPQVNDLTQKIETWIEQQEKKSQ